MTRRILLKIAYDGTDYHGFQKQPGQPTIQGEVERAICEVTGEEAELIGGSRTDAGVHSLGNLAVFDTGSIMPAEKFARALNAHLSTDIAVQESREVSERFHPRKCRSIKTYEYSILRGSCRIPTCERYMHHEYRQLNIAEMSLAAAQFIGTHDFTSFCAAGSDKEDKVREIMDAQIRPIDDMMRHISYLIFRVSGTGFLYNMVRIMAGTLLEVGLGNLHGTDIERILLAKSRAAAGPTAPAKGLCHIKTEIMEQML